jgi:hypothetical protein
VRLRGGAPADTRARQQLQFPRRDQIPYRGEGGQIVGAGFTWNRIEQLAERHHLGGDVLKNPVTRDGNPLDGRFFFLKDGAHERRIPVMLIRADAQIDRGEYSWTHMASSEPDLLPIQTASERYGISLSALYRYLRDGRLTRYRRGFDKVTYVDVQELGRLTVMTSDRWFTADVPLEDSDPILHRLLNRLNAISPGRGWAHAGWGSGVWVGGQKARAYTTLKFRAGRIRDVVPEIAQALQAADPAGTVDIHHIRLAEHPFR